MRSIVGVQVVDSGSIRVLGLPAGSRALRRRVAYVTQQASVYDDLTVRQNLRYFARILGAAPSDEPTVGLDPVLRVQLWGLFHELAAAGATLLVSSHVMDEAKRCDRLLLMREGELLADDTVEGVLAYTGTDDMEAAFLELIARGVPDLQPHGRHARPQSGTEAPR
jgi:ABC-2 type transport system ATP-binding protein